MATNVTLNGFPQVLRAKVFSGSGAEPARIIVDTIVGSGNATPWPEITTLTIASGTGTFVWNDVKVVMAPRVRRGKQRVILEDERWKLRFPIAGDSFNMRDSSGVVEVSTAATIADLVAGISGTTGIPISTGSVVDYFPAANWRGKTAYEALKELLYNSVSRLHYDPISQEYSVWSAGAGSLPSQTKQIFRYGPDRGLGNILVGSSPIVYEAELSMTAVVLNSSGQIVNLSTFIPNEFFNGFASEAGDLAQQSRLRQGAFRLWKNFNAYRELLPQRLLTVASGADYPLNVSAHLVNEDNASQMTVYNVVRPTGSEYSKESLRGLLITQHPFLRSTNGVLNTTANARISYYELDETGARDRLTASRSVGSGSVTKLLVMPWIRPISSTGSDIPSPGWEGLLSDVADALQQKYDKPSRTLESVGMLPPVASGRIGAVEYIASAWPRSDVRTRCAIDFDPRQTMVR